jgi:hypothetical protein
MHHGERVLAFPYLELTLITHQLAHLFLLSPTKNLSCDEKLRPDPLRVHQLFANLAQSVNSASQFIQKFKVLITRMKAPQPPNSPGAHRVNPCLFTCPWFRRLFMAR